MKRQAYLIDPEKNRVTEVEYDGLQDIYRLLDCDNVDLARLPNGEGIYVDDNFPPGHHRFFFLTAGYPQWLAGKGLYVGPIDSRGYERRPVTPRAVVRKRTKCADINTIQFLLAIDRFQASRTSSTPES